MFSQCNGTKEQGNIGLGAAIAAFTAIGATVLLPLNDSQPYDLVIDFEGILQKVSVKTTKFTEPSGNYTVGLRQRGGTDKRSKPFSNKECDLLFVLTASGDKYCIPTQDIKNKNAITFCKKYEQYKVR